MRRSESEKVADALVEGASKVTWNPQLFIGVIMAAHPHVQRMVIHTAVELIKVYLQNARNPHLRYRTDSVATSYAEEIDPVDLTDFDKPW